MFLIKCECGCFYTLQEDKLNYPLLPEPRRCPNCGIEHSFQNDLWAKHMNLPDMNIRRIPDDAKFSVTFDPSV